MITAGIDCGAKNVKAVILKDGKVISKTMRLAGLDTAAAAEAVFDEALQLIGFRRKDVSRVIATGVGRKELKFKDDVITEVGADARGIHYLYPDVRTVIDVGTEEGRAIRIDSVGKVVDFTINEKCAAGTGAFIEAMARALEVPLEELGELSLKSTQSIPVNAQCAVFAESEVVSLVHRQIPKSDIARAIHDAIADRVTSMVRRVGIEERTALIGGVARNIGFVRSLKENLQMDIIAVDSPEFVSAIGAALIAADGNEDGARVT